MSKRSITLKRGRKLSGKGFALKVLSVGWHSEGNQPLQQVVEVEVTTDPKDPPVDVTDDTGADPKEV